MRGITKHESGSRGNQWSVVIWGVAALLLLAPLLAMQFTDEVNWDKADFIVVGAMLFAACGVYELATRLNGNTAYRAATGLALVTAFVLVWINLAVGVFGSEDNLANLMFAGVLAVGIVGAILARFQARWMAIAMNTTAASQALVAAIGLLLGFGPTVLLAALFAIPWLVSAQLFRTAALETGGAGS